jgi:hypothetical protein
MIQQIWLQQIWNLVIQPALTASDRSGDYGFPGFTTINAPAEENVAAMVIVPNRRSDLA